jgi:hypothetical protein
LVHAPDFAEGAGIDIHIRTTIRCDHSFIEDAAIKIGDDIFEVSSWDVYSLNGVMSADLSNFVGPFTVEHVQVDAKKHVFKLHFGGEESLEIGTFKDWVNIKAVSALDDAWGFSQGLMGQFRTGKMLARNGTTTLSDPTSLDNNGISLPRNQCSFPLPASLSSVNHSAHGAQFLQHHHPDKHSLPLLPRQQYMPPFNCFQGGPPNYKPASQTLFQHMSWKVLEKGLVHRFKLGPVEILSKELTGILAANDLPSLSFDTW